MNPEALSNDIYRALRAAGLPTTKKNAESFTGSREAYYVEVEGDQGEVSGWNGASPERAATALKAAGFYAEVSYEDLHGRHSPVPGVIVRRILKE